MNKLFYLSAILCLVIASCDDEHNDDIPEPKTSFWEHSHLTFEGLQGPVSRIVEKTYPLSKDTEEEGGEETLVFTMRFNAAGQMTYYNSIGIEDPTRGVWQTIASYSYKYDDNGRMLQASVTPLGDEPIVYHLEYGEHENYIPLIFPLGNMDFFLLKGLKSITGGDVTYVFDGEKATYKEEAWTGDTETTYLYETGNPYPIKKIITISRGGDVLGEEVTTYMYGAEGLLLRKDTKTESERTITRYAEGQFLLPVSKKIDMGTGNETYPIDWAYVYDSSARLQRIDYIENKGMADEMTSKEEYTYLSFDTSGNWIDSKQLQSSSIDWSHTDGLIGVRREIAY